MLNENTLAFIFVVLAISHYSVNILLTAHVPVLIDRCSNVAATPDHSS